MDNSEIAYFSLGKGTNVFVQFFSKKMTFDKKIAALDKKKSKIELEFTEIQEKMIEKAEKKLFGNNLVPSSSKKQVIYNIKNSGILVKWIEQLLSLTLRLFSKNLEKKSNSDLDENIADSYIVSIGKGKK